MMNSIERVSCRNNKLELFDYKRSPFCGVAAFSSWLSHYVSLKQRHRFTLNPSELFSRVFPDFDKKMLGPPNQIEQIVHYWQSNQCGGNFFQNEDLLGSAPYIEGVDIESNKRPLKLSARIAQVLREGLPVIADFPFYVSSFLPLGSSLLQLPKKDEKAYGRHFVLIDGFICQSEYGFPNAKEDYFTFRNCWGADWGESGFGMMPYNFFSQTSELRVYFLAIKE